MAVVVMVVVLAPCSDTSLVVQNTSIVLPVSVVYGLQWQIGKKSLVVTYVTAYCAKERYSTRTSRPLFSSFRNSLTHLKRGGERSQQNQTTVHDIYVCFHLCLKT